MTCRYRLLDLFCRAGGSSYGYDLAGFEVWGVDKDPQPRFPFPERFIQADAIEYLAEHGHEYDVIAASPPCQKYSLTEKIMGSDAPRLIAPVRLMCQALGVPYVIENVEGAAPYMQNPLMLCGPMFGLKTYRHRYFESNVHLHPLDHPPHTAPLVKMGRPPREGHFHHIVGNFSGVSYAREVMEIPWMNRNELSEAIPPRYTKYVGSQIRRYLP